MKKDLSVRQQMYQGVVRFLPILYWLPKVNSTSFKSDLIAAFSSAIFALPQCLAFALIAGLPPEFGLYSAIIAPFVCVFLGSSFHTVAGPTVATSVVLYEIVNQYAAPQSPLFISYVLIVTLVAGIIQIMLGLLRAGSLTVFISKTVVSGFSSGAALLIISNQLSSFFGLSIDRESNMFYQIGSIISHIEETQIDIFLLSLITFTSCIVVKKIFKRIPYLLVAMIISSIVAILIKKYSPDSNIEMIGALPQGAPPFVKPSLRLEDVGQLFTSAMAIAILGFIQTISIGKAIAEKSGQKIDANQEFIAQGASNVCCSFFSSFFSSTSFTRTAVSYASGAKTPMANLISSGIILLVIVYASNITEFLPKASMSAIIILVGFQLIDFRYMRNIAKTSKAEFAVFMVTLLSTLVLSLEFAIYSGVILSLLLYLQKTSQPEVVSVATDKHDSFLRLREISSKFNKECPQLKIIRIDGSLFFGATDHVRTWLGSVNINRQNNILLICDGITLIDISGAEMLLSLKRRLQGKGGDLYLSGLKKDARAFLVNSPFWKKLDAPTHIFNYSAEAINAIFNKLDRVKCRYCDKRIFVECDQVEQVKLEFKDNNNLMNL